MIVSSVKRDNAWNSKETCLDPELNPFLMATIIISLINDTLVFLAITWRLLRNSYVEVPHTLRSGFRIVILGDYLPAFSKVLLKEGQAYYLLVSTFLIYVSCFKSSANSSFHRTIVTLNMVSVIMLCLPSNPNVLKIIFAVPNVVLTNVMACRVFRNTMLFSSGTESGTDIISTVQVQEI